MFSKLLGRALQTAILVLVSLGCVDPVQEGPVLSRKGITAYDSGNFRKAVDYLTQAIDHPIRDRPLAELWTILGNAHNELGELDRALECYEIAVSVEPDQTQALVGIGIVSRLNGDFTRAESSYRKALEIDSESVEAHSSLGVLYILMNSPKQAIPFLEKAISINPQYAVSHANLALAYAATGRFDEADVSLKQGVILGYQNGKTIQNRIEALKSLSPLGSVDDRQENTFP